MEWSSSEKKWIEMVEKKIRMRNREIVEHEIEDRK